MIYDSLIFYEQWSRSICVGERRNANPVLCLANVFTFSHCTSLMQWCMLTYRTSWFSCESHFWVHVLLQYLWVKSSSSWLDELLSHIAFSAPSIISSLPRRGFVTFFESVSVSTSDYTLQGLSSPTTFSLGICSLLAWHENAAGCSVVFRVYSVAFPLDDLSQSCNKTIRWWSWRQEIHEASQCIYLDGDLACASRVVLSISVYGVGVLTVSI